MKFFSKQKKYKKYHHIWYRNNKRYFSLSCTFYGSKCNEPYKLQIEHLKLLTKILKKVLKPYGRQVRIRLRVFPDIIVTKKPKDIRMGRGKGNPARKECYVKGGTVIVEVSHILDFAAHEAFGKCAYKSGVSRSIVRNKTMFAKLDTDNPWASVQEEEKESWPYGKYHIDHRFIYRVAIDYWNELNDNWLFAKTFEQWRDRLTATVKYNDRDSDWWYDDIPLKKPRKKRAIKISSTNEKQPGKRSRKAVVAIEEEQPKKRGRRAVVAVEEEQPKKRGRRAVVAVEEEQPKKRGRRAVVAVEEEQPKKRGRRAVVSVEEEQPKKRGRRAVVAVEEEQPKKRSRQAVVAVEEEQPKKRGKR